MSNFFPDDLDRAFGSQQSVEESSHIIVSDPDISRFSYPATESSEDDSAYTLIRSAESSSSALNVSAYDYLPSSRPSPRNNNYNIHLQKAYRSGSDSHQLLSCYESSSSKTNSLILSGIQSFSSGCFHIAYESKINTRNSFKAMNALRKTGDLCDVVLLVGARKIPAHRVILAGSSPYFKAMFTNELTESKQNEVKLFDLEPSAVEALVNFCYTSEIRVEVETVQSLLSAACLLQMNEIKLLCCEFLKRQLDPSNCLGIRAFADIHSCPDLMNLANKFVHQNFAEVVASEEFLLLPLPQLVDLISSDDLGVTSEESVYHAVLRWIHYDPTNRGSLLPRLLGHVRLPLLSPSFLVHVVGCNPVIRADSACRDLVDEAKNYLLLPSERSSFSGARTRPRGGRIDQSGGCLMVVGGWCSGDAIASAECLDTEGVWRAVAPMHKARCGVGVGVLNDLLFAVGGHDGQSYLNSVERYDPHTNLWSCEVAPTSTCRTSVGVAVLNEQLYAVGGQDGVTCLNVVERYDPSINRWLKTASMATRRLGVGVAVLEGALYAVGGSDGQTPLSSVERFDPRVGSWSSLAPMAARRKHLGLAVFRGQVYAAGGRDDSTELSSVECYDPRMDAWCSVVAMSSRRSGVCLTVLRNQLVAVGGFDGTAYLKSMEVYDPETACWNLRGCMISRRLGGGAGVLRFPVRGICASSSSTEEGRDLYDTPASLAVFDLANQYHSGNDDTAPDISRALR